VDHPGIAQGTFGPGKAMLSKSVIETPHLASPPIVFSATQSWWSDDRNTPGS
jgi:hypothetical protein